MKRIGFTLFAIALYFLLIVPTISYGNPACTKFYIDIANKSQVDHIRAKYNTPTALAVKFSYPGLLKLRQLYHQLPVSRIIDDAVTNTDRDWATVKTQAPIFLRWNRFENSFLSINPTYLKSYELLDAIKKNNVQSLKDRENGIALISWFIHPDLNKRQSDGNFKRGILIKDLDTSRTRYYASILDLTLQDLPYLMELKTIAVDQLKSLYGVDLNRDSVRFDFHFPYAIDTATLHLHVRVNSPDHPLELSKSYSIDEIIHYLASGRSVIDLILDRQKSVGWFYFATSAKKMIDLIPVEHQKEVSNPYLL